MTDFPGFQAILDAVPGYRSKLKELREIILANTIMCGEHPSPTFGEERLVRFINDRFTEMDLSNVSSDEVGNAMGLLPGSVGKGHILVAAHVDKIWDEKQAHTVQVTENSMVGRGIADNSLGVGAMISLPDIFKHLGIQLRNNLVFLGASRSLGRGDLGGLRFFLENTPIDIRSAVAIEGVQLGRLSYSCLGMNRLEITVNTPDERDLFSWGRSGAIIGMNKIIQRILTIQTPQEPRTVIILGSVQSGNTYNVPAHQSVLRFEVRSEAPGMVANIREQIEEIIEEVNAEQRIEASMSVIARRKPGGIGFSHPLTRAARDIMNTLEIQPKIAPSISELSVLLEHEIPSLTLGISKGENKHEPNECIEIEPIFSGLAQLVAVLQFIDGGLENGDN